jgi:hypothetical protein
MRSRPPADLPAFLFSRKGLGTSCQLRQEPEAVSIGFGLATQRQVPQESCAAAAQDVMNRQGVTYAEPIVDHAMARDRFLKIAESHLQRRGAGSDRR